MKSEEIKRIIDKGIEKITVAEELLIKVTMMMLLQELIMRSIIA